MESRNIGKIIYKAAGVLLVLYALTYGMLAAIPDQGFGQSSRNIFYHVPLWFTVIVLMAISVVQSIRFLRLSDPDLDYKGNLLIPDMKAKESAITGTLFIILGLVTGILWSRVTWAAELTNAQFVPLLFREPVFVSASISLLMYLAYFLLRSSFSEPTQKAKFAAVYNIFAFAALIPLFFIVPKLLPGLHPTSADSEAGGGSFVMSGKIDNSYRVILYPAALGFILLSIWMLELRTRIQLVRLRVEEMLES